MEPLPPGAEEEEDLPPGVEAEPVPPGADQAIGGTDPSVVLQTSQPGAESGAAGYGYPYASYGAGYTDSQYDASYQAYYNSYYYPQGQGYGAPPTSTGRLQLALLC